ncbi:MAG: ATP-dependent zinc metalloprotease FtsH [Rhodospirillales bacterium]
MEKKTRIMLLYAVISMIGVLALNALWWQDRKVAVISFSEFERALDRGAIEELVVGKDRIRGRFSTPQDGKRDFVTTRVESGLAERLKASGAEYSGAVEETWLTNLLSWILPVLLFFGLWLFVIRRFVARQGFGGAMEIGKSRAKIYVETDTKVSFEDVAGVDEAKVELQEVIDFLRAPREYGKLGAHVPKGVLLVGPPGTGKTLLARAVAGEAAVPFFSITGSEFVEMFVGVGAARVRDLFEQARAKAPAIIFVDELDALGRARGAMPGMGGQDEREQTLNQLLAELDGFDPSDGLVLLAATNRPEILDPALLRAGRFDRQILVDRPDRAGRVQILEVHLRKIALDEDVEAEPIAALTTGFSGADLANLVNEAALLATRRRAEAVTEEDFLQAIERIVAGLEKRNRLLNPHERETVAYHEMGHTLVALALPGLEEVHKVSIIPRGIGALGYTIQRPTEDRFLMTRQELENKIAVLLGGRAAEKLVFDQLSTGAADDLAKVTDIARSMVARYGMDEGLGCVSLESDRPSLLGQTTPTYLERRYSEATAEAMDQAVKGVVAAAFERAYAILADNRAILERSAKELLARETLDEAEILTLTEGLDRPKD